MITHSTTLSTSSSIEESGGRRVLPLEKIFISANTEEQEMKVHSTATLGRTVLVEYRHA